MHRHPIPSPAASKYIVDPRADDDIDRRGFLKCMAWAGTGILWTLKGGIPTSVPVGQLGAMQAGPSHDMGLFFAQISDSHIGFNKAANSDVTATLQAAVAKLNALPQTPAFVLHTGDITQLSKSEEFDTAREVLKGIKTDRVLYVPGEHDVLGDNGAAYLQRYGAGTQGGGWFSFDQGGVHFIGLVNVINLKAGGLGALGAEQLDWLARDVRGLSTSTPIVVFAHIPLWSVYPQWGWGTDDAEQALALLKRFGSVTVLNGHIHQVMQKVEGNVAFHSAMSTAFPQPIPGTAPSPGPMTVPADQLRRFLGLASVTFVPGAHSLAIVDATLSGEPVMHPDMEHGTMDTTRRAPSARPAANEIAIDNFSFSPATLTVSPETEVTWINHDDVPHQIVSTTHAFASSAVLDTNQRFSFTFSKAGTYDYFCSVHPRMTGRVTVS